MTNREEGYAGLCKLWASEEFKSKSMKHRTNRGTEALHTYGGDGHIRLQKRIVSKISFKSIIYK